MCGKISKARRCDQCDRTCGLFLLFEYQRFCITVKHILQVIYNVIGCFVQKKHLLKKAGAFSLNKLVHTFVLNGIAPSENRKLLLRLCNVKCSFSNKIETLQNKTYDHISI